MRAEVNVVSLERCRELLGDSGKYASDEQVIALRDQMMSIASYALDQLSKGGQDGHDEEDE